MLLGFLGVYRGGYLTSLRPMVSVGLRGGGPSSRGGRRRVLFKSRKNIPKKDTSKKKLKKEEKPLKTRKEFPETWLWVEEKLA